MTKLVLFAAFTEETKTEGRTSQHRQHKDNLLVIQNSSTQVTTPLYSGENLNLSLPGISLENNFS